MGQVPHTDVTNPHASWFIYVRRVACVCVTWRMHVWNTIYFHDMIPTSGLWYASVCVRAGVCMCGRQYLFLCWCVYVWHDVCVWCATCLCEISYTSMVWFIQMDWGECLTHTNTHTRTHTCRQLCACRCCMCVGSCVCVCLCAYVYVYECVEHSCPREWWNWYVCMFVCTCARVSVYVRLCGKQLLEDDDIDPSNIWVYCRHFHHYTPMKDQCN